jgi:hypothetical protein
MEALSVPHTNLLLIREDNVFMPSIILYSNSALDCRLGEISVGLFFGIELRLRELFDL